MYFGLPQYHGIIPHPGSPFVSVCHNIMTSFYILHRCLFCLPAYHGIICLPDLRLCFLARGNLWVMFWQVICHSSSGWRYLCRYTPGVAKTGIRDMLMSNQQRLETLMSVSAQSGYRTSEVPRYMWYAQRGRGTEICDMPRGAEVPRHMWYA